MNAKMPTIVGISIFMSSILRTLVSADLSMNKTFYNLGAMNYSSVSSCIQYIRDTLFYKGTPYYLLRDLSSAL